MGPERAKATNPAQDEAEAGAEALASAKKVVPAKVGNCPKPKAEECLHSRQPAEARLHSILDCVPATAR